MKMTKKAAASNDAAITTLQMLALDRALGEVVVQTQCLTLREKGKLVDMQRRLRAMRIELEVVYRLPDRAPLHLMPADWPVR